MCIQNQSELSHLGDGQEKRLSDSISMQMGALQLNTYRQKYMYIFIHAHQPVVATAEKDGMSVFGGC